MVVLAISIDRGRDEKVRKLVKGYVGRKNLTFLNLLDPKSATAAQYGVRGIPMTFFINSRGIVVAYATGYREWDSKEGRKMLDQLLSETT
jgi:thioredoxin-like negative regulator of GroEL